MNKKLTKTIILIVFVVFLGINKVYAKTAKTCVYSLGDENITITINDTFSDASISKGPSGDVKNWKSNHSSGFSGYDYFESNGRTCPPILIEARYATANDVYFSDSKNLQKIRNYAKDQAVLWYVGDYVYDLVSETDGEGLRGNTSNNNTVNKVTTKTCSCSGKDNGKQISVEFEVNDNLSAPRPKIWFSGGGASRTIDNWEEGYKDSKYVYKTDLINNNKCPDYAVISRSPHLTVIDSGYLLLVSDSANLSSVKSEAKKFGNNWFGASPATVYSVACQETTTSSNTPGTDPDEPPEEYDDPEVGVTVTPLNPGLTTYSCGGSYLTGIPQKIPKLTKFIYIFLQILVPIAIIILGSLDLLKAVAAQKEDEIKKGQQVFIKRLIGAIIVFFVFAIVKLLISLISANSTSIIDCLDCFLKENNSCIRE